MSVQSPFDDGLYIRPIRPERRWIRFFVKYYPYIVGILISIIVFLSLVDVNAVLTVLLLAGYWVYLVGRVRYRLYKQWAGIYSNPAVQFIRALILVVGVTSLISYAYRQTDVLNRTQIDTLWLLYIPAISTISQRGSRATFFIVLFIVIGCLLGLHLTHLRAATETRLIPREFVVQSIWVILLSLTPYIMVRYMSDVVADLNLIINVQNRMRQMEGAFLRSRVQLNEKDYIEKAVEIISGDLSYDHVNIFRLDKYSKEMICVAGACKEGKKLAQAGYRVNILNQNSIIGHVAKTGEPYISNNAAEDTLYLPHDAFPHTRAELVVPVKVRNRLYGVLDIQVHQRNYFLEQDLKAIEILANHIGWVIDNSEQFAHINWVNRIIETIAVPILTQNHLNETLKEIANSALHQLDADLVFLYSCDPDMGYALSGPIHSGALLHPELIDPSSLDDDNVVSRLISGSEQIYMNADLGMIKLEEDPVFRPSETHILNSKPTFVEREGIKSNVIIRLLNNKQCVGILFLNFRRARSFSEWEKKRYLSFAHLAGLAIQKMQLQQHIIQNTIQKETNNLSNLIHDILIGDTVGLFKILKSIDVSVENLPDKLTKRIDLAMDATEQLYHDIRWINQLPDGNTFDNIMLELENLFNLFREIFNINVKTKWTDDMSRVSTELNTVLFIVIREALTNAVRHGKAGNIVISGSIKSDDIHVVIVDDGIGFNPKLAKRRNGLRSMKYRIEEMGGALRVSSKPGKGTKIAIHVPLQNSIKGV